MTLKELNSQLLNELKQSKETAKKYREYFEIEMKIKNELYFFILSNGLYDKLLNYKPSTERKNTDYRQKCLLWFNTHLPETKN